MSAPLRASSSATAPPKQKPNAPIRVGSSGALPACAFSAATAAPRALAQRHATVGVGLHHLALSPRPRPWAGRPCRRHRRPASRNRRRRCPWPFDRDVGLTPIQFGTITSPGRCRRAGIVVDQRAAEIVARRPSIRPVRPALRPGRVTPRRDKGEQWRMANVLSRRADEARAVLRPERSVQIASACTPRCCAWTEARQVRRCPVPGSR